MNVSFVPAPLQIKQNSTGRSFTLHPSTAADWAGQWPTDRSGDVLVSEAPGSADGSLFGYWLGNCTLESSDTLEAIQKHMDDHDVVGVHVIPGFPDDAHSSLKAVLAQLKAAASPCTHPAELSTKAGTFAYAAYADNGNVIIWSRRREQVTPVAAKYGKPVVPVIVLEVEKQGGALVPPEGQVIANPSVDAPAEQVLPKFMQLLAQADAVSLDDGAILTDWSTVPWKGEPLNDVVRFTWTDGEMDYEAVLTEEGIACGTFDSKGQFIGQNQEGNLITVQFYLLQRLGVDANTVH